MRIIFLIFICAGILLSACGNEDTENITVPDSLGLTSFTVNTTLYNKHANLLIEHKLLKGQSEQQVKDLKDGQQRVAGLDNKISQLKQENTDLGVSFNNISAKILVLFIENERLLKSVKDLADAYALKQDSNQLLVERISEVNSRTDNVTSGNWTAEQVINFYDIWDELFGGQ